jgi:hypothetical protein
LTGDVQGHAGSTPFARWGNRLAVGVSFLLLAFARRRAAPA